MLPGMMAPDAGLTASSSIREVVHALGLTTNLKVLLDAGDKDSYTSGQKWLDLSGNGHDFFRGTSSTASTADGDPAFSGTAGGRSSSEYFVTDGTVSWLDYDSATETWMNNLHKNNAKFTIAAWVRSSTRTGVIFWTNVDAASGTRNGANIIFQLSPSPSLGEVTLFVHNDSSPNATPMLTLDSNLSISANTWSFIAVSVDEAAGTSVLCLNGSQATPTSTYSSPSTSNATGVAEIVVHDLRMANFMAWESRALTSSELTALYQATRGKFGV